MRNKRKQQLDSSKQFISGPSTIEEYGFSGLNETDVKLARTRHGRNVVDQDEKNVITEIFSDLIKEPMIIILVIISTIYFLTDNQNEGWFLLVAVLIIGAISIYQERRSHSALERLKKLSQPHVKVIRSSKVVSIESEAVVVGDLMMVEEGTSIVADGQIVQSNDFSVNESMLTGESLSVFKDKNVENESGNKVYQGTFVSTGLAIVKVQAVGVGTRLAQIGKSMDDIAEQHSPLDKQIQATVKRMVQIGLVAFVLVWFFNYIQTMAFLPSLVFALTIAMSILPEEIPVAFATFMAMGAWRLAAKDVIVKNSKTVEALGNATILCVDKTGTITKNEMTLVFTYSHMNGRSVDTREEPLANAKVITAAMWASEPIPFDPMEVALHEAYKQLGSESTSYKMIHEYPLGGKPPMMTHLYENEFGDRLIACKGAPEMIMRVCKLSQKERAVVQAQLHAYTKAGYRVLGVGESDYEGDDFPEYQQELPFHFLGLVAFYDPPKDNIKAVFEELDSAGVITKIITGDNAETTASIAEQINFSGRDMVIDGTVLMEMDDSNFLEAVNKNSLFTRMFPEAKLRVVSALKAQGHIVSMIGDGVNDGPALKAANIGVAMGHKGSEVAKDAADLVLATDDLANLTVAIASGRRIHANLKKAIRYVTSIHIPIVIAVFLPLALGWVYPHIFTPVHVIILELIMGPTCSIVYENEPLEENAMNLPPVPFTEHYFTRPELILTIIQGLMIAVGTMVTYRYACGFMDEAATRSMVFTTLMSANIALTLINRSAYYSILKTIRYKNNMMPLVIGLAILLLLAFLYIPFMQAFFLFGYLNLAQLLTAVAIGLVSVFWYEFYKYYLRQSTTE